MSAISAVLEFLAATSRQDVRPAEAQQRFAELQASWADTPMELVWEEEAYDGSAHYDALLRTPDGATVSLSVAGDGALPWPLRGVRRWSDADLAQVNGKLLKMQDAVAFLDIVWRETPILQRIVNLALMRDELDRHPVTLGDAELQRGMDTLRRAHGLFGSDETQRWMAAHGLTHERLEKLVADELMVDALRERVAAGRVEACFAERGAEFDRATLARIEFTDEEAARRVRRQIAAGELDFFAAAQQAFVAGADEARPLFVTLRRRELPEAAAAAIFAANPGSVVGPLQVGDAWIVARVIARTAAQLDEATRVAVKQRLFDEWLAARRDEAVVTWFWGTADRTTQAA